METLGCVREDGSWVVGIYSYEGNSIVLYMTCRYILDIHLHMANWIRQICNHKYVACQEMSFCSFVAKSTGPSLEFIQSCSAPYFPMLLEWMVACHFRQCIGCIRMYASKKSRPLPKVMRGGGRPGRGFHRIKSVLGTSACQICRPWKVTPSMTENPAAQRKIPTLAIETRWSKWEQRAMEQLKP